MVIRKLWNINLKKIIAIFLFEKHFWWAICKTTYNHCCDFAEHTAITRGIYVIDIDMLATCVKSNINFVIVVDWLWLTDTAGVRDVSVLCVVVGVRGVTQLHDVVYIVCEWSSTILRFNATTHQQLTDIDVRDLRRPWDIVACERTSQVYVADWDELCIWRVSSDGEDIQRWLPKSPSDTLKPRSLSVTSTRLLVTSRDTHQLTLFDAVGDELRRVQLPDDVVPLHAVESPTGTFIVSRYNPQLDQGQVSEVNTGGEVLRQFSRSHSLSFSCSQHVAVDSHGNILVADCDNRRILLLDAQLTLRRVVVDADQLNENNDNQPWRLCYKEQSGQLLVGLGWGGSVVAVFSVVC